MNPKQCSPLLVREMFRSLLANTVPGTSHQRLSTSTTSAPLTGPPKKILFDILKTIKIIVEKNMMVIVGDLSAHGM